MSTRRVIGLAVIGLAFAPVAEHKASARTMTSPPGALAPDAAVRPDNRVAMPDPRGAGPRAVEAPRPPAPVERCRPGEAELDELSGLSSDGEAWYAVNDSGDSVRVYVLDPVDCSVREVRTAAADPYDVEDLALGEDGTLWLADTGDNAMSRDTVALHAMPSAGGSALYRLRYPDGPHDAEALLLDSSGVPHLITKEPFGAARVYRPSGGLIEDGVTELRQVGALALPATETPGGPFSGGLGSALVTGAEMNDDGTVVAVRTYTDAYLFSAPDGDIAHALRGTPSVVPLPNEPQGEAIAWEPDGTLLSASEGVGQPVRAVRGVASMVTSRSTTSPEPPSTSEQTPMGDSRGGNASEPADRAGPSFGQSLALAGGFAVLVLAAAGAMRRLWSR